MAGQRSFHPPVLFRPEHTEHEMTKLTAAFTRFDQDGNGVLDEKEQNEKRQKLEGERVSPDGWWRGCKETAHSPLPAVHPEHKPTWKSSNGWVGKSSLE